jgi:hypothetical protein
VIDKIKDDGFALTLEDDVFAFLGVKIIKDKTYGKIELRQNGLIDKILCTCKMIDCNRKATPRNTTPLGMDANGEKCEADWDYGSVVGMLMYLCWNSPPDIQYPVCRPPIFAVHPLSPSKP